MKHFFLIFFLLTGSYTIGLSQSKILQELKDSNAIQVHLFFTPSTLRMLNFQNDPDYNDIQ